MFFPAVEEVHVDGARAAVERGYNRSDARNSAEAEEVSLKWFRNQASHDFLASAKDLRGTTGSATGAASKRAPQLDWPPTISPRSLRFG